MVFPLLGMGSAIRSNERTEPIVPGLIVFWGGGCPDRIVRLGRAGSGGTGGIPSDRKGRGAASELAVPEAIFLEDRCHLRCYVGEERITPVCNPARFVYEADAGEFLQTLAETVVRQP